MPWRIPAILMTLMALSHVDGSRVATTTTVIAVVLRAELVQCDPCSQGKSTGSQASEPTFDASRVSAPGWQQVQPEDDDSACSSQSYLYLIIGILLFTCAPAIACICHYKTHNNVDNIESDQPTSSQTKLDLTMLDACTFEATTAQPGDMSSIVSDPAFECSICLCSIQTGDMVSKLPCSHTFHHACIYRWLSLKHRCNELLCPLCKQHIDGSHRVEIAEPLTSTQVPPLPEVVPMAAGVAEVAEAMAGPDSSPHSSPSLSSCPTQLHPPSETEVAAHEP